MILCFFPLEYCNFLQFSHAVDMLVLIYKGQSEGNAIVHVILHAKYSGAGMLHQYPVSSSTACQVPTL